MKKQTYKEYMEEYYEKLYADKMTNSILKGTHYSYSNMADWLARFREDKRKGKF